MSIPESVDYIITRYKEYIDWIQYIPNNYRNIYIYNKGPNDSIFKDYSLSPEIKSKVKIIKLENIGRIDHTLVYHILEHFDSLPDILISLPGTVMMSPRKGGYFSAIVRRLSTNIVKYKGFYSPRFKKVGSDFNYNISEYEPEGLCNRKNGNPFIKSEYSNFQEWKKAIIDDRPIKYIAMRGMFAVCKENIRYVDKKIYENLLKSLSVGDNIENGHFAERIWAHLFRQYAFDTFVEPIKNTNNSTNNGTNNGTNNSTNNDTNNGTNNGTIQVLRRNE